MKKLILLTVLLVTSLVTTSASAAPGDACQGIATGKTVSVTPANWSTYATSLSSFVRYEFAPGTYATGISVDGLQNVEFVALGPVTIQGAAPGFPNAAVHIQDSSQIEFSTALVGPHCFFWDVRGPVSGVRMQDNSACVGFQGLRAMNHTGTGLSVSDDDDLDLVVMGFRGCVAQLSNNGTGMSVAGANLVTLFQVDIDSNSNTGAVVRNAHGTLQSTRVRHNGGLGLSVNEGYPWGQTDTDWSLVSVWIHGSGSDGARFQSVGSVDWNYGHASHNGGSGLVSGETDRGLDLTHVELNDNGGEGLQVWGATLNDLGLDEVTAHRNDSHGLWIDTVFDVSMNDVDADDNGGKGVWLEDVNDANLNDLAVNDSTLYGIHLETVSYTELTNSVVTGATNGVWVRGSGSESLVFQDNFVGARIGLRGIDLGRVGVEDSTFDGSGLTTVLDGVQLTGTGRAQLRDNEVTRYQRGLVLANGGQVNVEGNHVYEIGNIGILAYDNGATVVTRSHVYDVLDSVNGKGISLSHNASSVAVNNVVSKVAWTPQTPTLCALYTAGISLTWGAGQIARVLNNTVDHVGGPALRYDAEVRAGNASLHNNLSTYSCYAVRSLGTPLTGQNDGYHQIWGTPFTGSYTAANPLGANPLVLSPVPFEDASWARLLSVSPMTGAGIWVPGITPSADYAGLPRSAGRISIGAFEPVAPFTSPGSKKGGKPQKR